MAAVTKIVFHDKGAPPHLDPVRPVAVEETKADKPEVRSALQAVPPEKPADK